jgi:hypothetical protein
MTTIISYSLLLVEFLHFDITGIILILTAFPAIVLREKETGGVENRATII